jgi:hypothetical protein
MDHRAVPAAPAISGARLGILAVIIVAVLAVVAAPAASESATHSTRPVFRIADVFAGDPAPVGTSTVRRTDHGMSLTLTAEALPAGHVVTLWWVVFNDPATCQAGIPGTSSCGPVDAMQGRGQFSLVKGAGRIVDRDGTARYGAHLRAGDTAGALIGPGLLDARGAEVVLVLKTHGPKIAGLVSQQLHTFAGGCADQTDAPPGAPLDLVGEPGANDCAEIQLSAHSPAL